MEKYLDYNGVKYLWNKLSMEDYPNNDTLITVIDAINDSLESTDKRVENLENGSNISLLGSYTSLETYQTGNQSILPENCEWGANYFLTTEGAVSNWENTNYCCTLTYIPVKASNNYVMFYEQKPIYVVHYCFYDSNYQLISYKSTTTNMITTPAGAAYLRVSILANQFDLAAGDFAVDENNHFTNPTGLIELYQQNHTNYLPGEYSEREILSKENCYIPWERILTGSIGLKHLDFVNEYSAISLCDTDKMTSGYNANGTGFGKVWDNTAYICTEPIAVNAGDKLSFWKLSNSKVSASLVSVRFVTAYNKDCTYVENQTYVKEYEVPEGVAYVMVTFTMSDIGSKDLAYIQRYEIADTYQGYHVPLEPIYKIKTDVIDGDLDTSLHVCLPPEICVPSGYTIELYNNQCCLEADKYHIQWIGDYGTAYDWKYSITGSDSLTGKDFVLTMNVVNDGLDIISQASTNIKFVAASLTNDQLIIPIGDSLTNGKKWISELYSTLSNKKIQFRGTRGTTNPALVNGITHEGRSGAGPGWYNTNSIPYTFDSNGLSTVDDLTTNPFWNTTTDSFDFDYYCNSETNGGAGYFQTSRGFPTSITPTGVLIFLGANEAQLDATPATNSIITLIKNIRNSTKGASIPIYVVNTQYRAPYIVATTADGFTTNTSGEFKFQNDVKYQNLMRKLNDEIAALENVYIMPISVTHDSAHNYPYEEESVNPYNTNETIRKYTDTIHPSDAGYTQMAVTMFGTICAHAK